MKIGIFNGRIVELPKGVRRDKIGWILRCASSDINYRTTIPELSNEELEFCLRYETRTTGRRQLESEMRKRSRVK